MVFAGLGLRMIAAGTALKVGRAEFVLKFVDAARERRLRQAERPGGGPNAAKFGDGRNISQLASHSIRGLVATLLPIQHWC